jgi:hypothetical protein
MKLDTKEHQKLIDTLIHMNEDEKHFALHFYYACEEGVSFDIPKSVRARLRELELMEWKGGNYFDVTQKLERLKPLLIEWQEMISSKYENHKHF